ncbi:endolytic transglycosylase MltG [Patescibacteria group bacterium]|nr:endolytic transglycosylase MltG [Patescibacteria group bacterium]
MNKLLTLKTKFSKSLFIIGVIAVAFFVIVVFIYLSFFSALQNKAELEQFTITVGNDDSREVAEQLKEQGFIKNETAFHIMLCDTKIRSGAYKISKSMNVWQITNTFKKGPYMKWIIIPEGLRKEQIAEILAQTLNWNEQEKSDWVTKQTTMKYDYLEGVYFPETYLIPIDETGLEIAQRFINKFNEKFASYADKFIQENIKWTTALKIASIVQREAAGKDDMPLIAGIIWNRLLNDMKLEVDATLQYARGDTGNGWWFPISVADKQIDSEYNTYLYKGLPPHPIANPGIDAIDAVLNPVETKCFYYLHDNDRNIHCAETYEEHLENIEKYLK